MKNIVLIGMMGCGKTTIGEILAKKLNMHFIDIDLYIENKYSMSISDMFEISEEYFRICESCCVEEVSKLENVVIATGGGVVQQSQNITYLQQNGWIVYVERPVENILQDIHENHRPLLKKGKDYFYELYQKRQPLYIKACNERIRNDGTLDDVVMKIIDKYQKK